MFSKCPPKIFCLKVLHSLGLENENDSSWITPYTINITLKQEVLESAKEYYFPCYTEQFLNQENITYSKYITIANHFLKHIGIVLEKRRNGKKTNDFRIHYFTRYRICPLNKTSEFFVSFD